MSIGSIGLGSMTVVMVAGGRRQEARGWWRPSGVEVGLVAGGREGLEA